MILKSYLINCNIYMNEYDLILSSYKNVFNNINSSIDYAFTL